MYVVSFDVGIKNLAFAVARVTYVSSSTGSTSSNSDGSSTRSTSKVIAVERWGTVCVCPANARTITKQSAVEHVVRALDELDFLACDTVLVESQPRIAPPMVRSAPTATHTPTDIAFERARTMFDFLREPMIYRCNVA
jgi:hypothetical protein